MDYSDLFTKIHHHLEQKPDKGQVADYIPYLSQIDPDKFGVHLTTVHGEDWGYGDSEEKFSIQSIAKVFSLTLASQIETSKLIGRVGVEPSGGPFNSLIQLEHDQGIPRNPFNNDGALVICDILVEHFDDPKNEMLNFVRQIAHNSQIEYSRHIAQSEKEVGYRNMALINLMKSFGNIRSDIDQVMDFYYDLCSIEMTCRELAHTFQFLATDGFDHIGNRQVVNHSTSKRINAIMQTCGFYDEAGEFTFRVGLPGKSGVGGGIAAVNPDKYSIAVWSPRLNKKGNSYRGMQFLERFTTETESSIF